MPRERFYSRSRSQSGAGSDVIRTTTGTSDGDIFVSNLSSSGNYEWGETFGSTGLDMGYDIAVNSETSESTWEALSWTVSTTSTQVHCRNTCLVLPCGLTDSFYGSASRKSKTPHDGNLAGCAPVEAIELLRLRSVLATPTGNGCRDAQQWNHMRTPRLCVSDATLA